MDAIKIARSIYETELNILWLKNHPEDLDESRTRDSQPRRRLWRHTSGILRLNPPVKTFALSRDV